MPEAVIPGPRKGMIETAEPNLTADIRYTKVAGHRREADCHVQVRHRAKPSVEKARCPRAFSN